jgi:tetratricopeptide (TPR) repeat protein
LLLATCPQERFRNGANAVEYATKACSLSKWQKPAYLTTLAAAYAESGDFDQAIRWQRKVLDLPEDAKQERDKARQRLDSYIEHKPWREP